jgi:hypothetical protein
MIAGAHQKEALEERLSVDLTAAQEQVPKKSSIAAKYLWGLQVILPGRHQPE